MTSQFILDCSVTMAWCFEEEACDYADCVLSSLAHSKALVPELWHLEVSHVLLMAERKQRIQEAQILRFSRLLESLPIDTDHNPPSLTDLTLIARLHHLTSYDVCYLHLALVRGLPLATLDKNLKNAAEKAGVPLFS